MNSFLDQFLTSEEISSLKRAFNSNEPFYIQKTKRPFNTIPFVQNFIDINSIKNNWHGPVDVHSKEIQDECNSMTVDIHRAAEHFKSGCGLLINDINNTYHSHNELIEELKVFFGVSALSYGRSLIYGTPKNGGSATHFDQNFNLIFQLSGKKKWKLEENKSVINPLTRHALNQECDPELQSYLLDDFPQNIDDFSYEFDLEEGSLLFVPIGHWHNTYASDDSFALNFTFTTPSWADILLTAMRARIISSDEWRKRVSGLNDKAVLEDNLVRFQSLLENLAKDLEGWSSVDVLSMIEGRDLRQ